MVQSFSGTIKANLPWRKILKWEITFSLKLCWTKQNIWNSPYSEIWHWYTTHVTLVFYMFQFEDYIKLQQSSNFISTKFTLGFDWLVFEEWRHGIYWRNYFAFPKISQNNSWKNEDYLVFLNITVSSLSTIIKWPTVRTPSWATWCLLKRTKFHGSYGSDLVG